jgi:hypothetical protein
MAINNVCVACRHQIDAAAKLCPYCGADPKTGQKIDTSALMQEVFQPKQLTRTEGVLQFARQRQGVVITMAIFITLVLLGALHQFALRRNETDVSNAAAVPLTEITDLTNQANDAKPEPMPPMQFQFDGRPQTMRTFIVEPGAVAPAQAAQQPAQPTQTR